MFGSVNRCDTVTPIIIREMERWPYTDYFFPVAERRGGIFRVAVTGEKKIHLCIHLCGCVCVCVCVCTMILTEENLSGHLTLLIISYIYIYI